MNRPGFDGDSVSTVHRRKLGGATDVAGNPIVDLGVFSNRWNESFSFALVDEQDLSEKERSIFGRTRDTIALQGAYPRQIKEVVISETMRINSTGAAEVLGYWDAINGRIVIKRDQLRTLPKYAGTLLHEVTHATSDAEDVSAEFEDALTRTLGAVAARSQRAV